MNPNATSGTSIGCAGGPAAGTPLGTPSHYFDPCVFTLQTAGTYGNLPRDVVIGPSLFNLDTAVTKTFAITERAHLDFRAEFFNILNHPNFGLINTTLFSLQSGNAFTGNIVRNGAAGQITSTMNTSRQIQFGLKLSF
jgi:hypothetical protein